MRLPDVQPIQLLNPAQPTATPWRRQEVADNLNERALLLNRHLAYD